MSREKTAQYLAHALLVPHVASTYAKHYRYLIPSRFRRECAYSRPKSDLETSNDDVTLPEGSLRSEKRSGSLPYPQSRDQPYVLRFA